MNKYQVIDVIDEGAYGIVLKALNKDTGKYVAIKKFKQGDEDQIIKRNIQRQIKMLKTLKSEYVVDLREAFKRKGKVYLIFQYMQKNLLNLIQQHQNGLHPEMINEIMYQLFKGLKFLHNKNIIHRDIKPENLLLSQDFKLKICDFGFTRVFTNPNQSLTDYVATRWYRSPELLVGEKYDNAIDIWAAGCIMGELIDGQPLFPGQNEMDQLYLIKKTLGQLTNNQLEKFTKNQRFIGLKFPDIRKLQTLQSKYLGKISKHALSFLKQCLKIDPKQRMTASAAFNHPYINSLGLKYGQKFEQEEFKNTNAYKKSKLKFSNDFKTQISPKIQNNLKSIYGNTKSRGFFNNVEQKDLMKIEERMESPKIRNYYKIPKNEFVGFQKVEKNQLIIFIKYNYEQINSLNFRSQFKYESKFQCS